MFVQFNIYFVALTALLLSISINYLLLFLSQKNILKTLNKIDENRLNKNNTPPFGGVAISLAFFIAAQFLGEANSIFIQIGTYGILIALVGFIDDIFNLHWKYKLILQFTFVSLPITNLGLYLNFETLINLDLNNYLNYFVSIIWIILLINSINFIDNMDSLAATVASSTCVQAIALTYYLNQNNLTDILVVLLFSIFGFLLFNLPPAKLYLGDSGSLFIGFLLGFLSILFNWNPDGFHTFSNTLSPLLLFFTIPVLDFMTVFKHRLTNNQSPFSGGTDHSSHRLLALGYTEKKILVITICYSFFNFMIIFLHLITDGVLSNAFLGIYIIQFVYIYFKIQKLQILK